MMPWKRSRTFCLFMCFLIMGILKEANHKYLPPVPVCLPSSKKLQLYYWSAARKTPLFKHSTFYFLFTTVHI